MSPKSFWVKSSVLFAEHRNLLAFTTDFFSSRESRTRRHKLSVVCNLSDERLLIEAAQQDPSRFAELYRRNFHRVYAFVASRLHDRDEAEEVTAEVFHEALLNLPRFQWRGAPFAAWLLRIAVNTLNDRWRRAARNGSGNENCLDDVEDSVSVAPEAERRAMLYQLVDRLPSDQRLVLLRRFVDQKSIREVAKELGRSEGAIKQLQFRALESLRRQMRSVYE